MLFKKGYIFIDIETGEKFKFIRNYSLRGSYKWLYESLGNKKKYVNSYKGLEEAFNKGIIKIIGVSE